MRARSFTPVGMRGARRLRPLLLLAVLASYAAQAAGAQTVEADAQAPARALFMQQIEALDALPTAGAISAPDPPLLRGYVLYPYLQAQRLRAPMRFGLAPDDAAIAALLARDGDVPSTRELRRDWLLDLARRQAWRPFLQHYIDARADAQLRCLDLQARIATTAPDDAAGMAALRQTLLRRWMTGTQLPDACVQPFDWARDRGWFTAELLQRRARLALEAGNAELAEFLLRPLPADAAPALRSWARLLRQPEREFDALAAAGRSALLSQEPAALLAGMSKLARRAPAAAAPRLRAIEDACGSPCGLQPPASLDKLRSELGLGYALSRLPESLAVFRAVEDAAVLDERAHEWRVRAALWARDWPQAARWIAQLPPALAAQPRWRYWKARALSHTGAREAARALYEALTGENNWYALLASARLERRYAPTPQPSPKDPAMQQQLAALPGAVRARELWLAQRSEWSAAEWSELLSKLDPPQLIQAAWLAQTWGAHLQAVVAASKAQVFDDFELLYPRPYEREVQAAATRAGVAAEWIYAVMRQESLYNPRARSRAKALGLLQLLPGTARAVARRNGLPAPAADDLFDPRTNIRLGTTHLRELLDDYGGEFVLVLGAYNAGPRPVLRWRPSAPLDLDIWVENVPYNETRSYIQRVLWHSAVFHWRAAGEPQQTTPLLRSIAPPAVAQR